MAGRKNRGDLDASLKKFQAGNNEELEKWAKAILYIKGNLEVVPPGWYNVNQLAKEMGFVPSGIGPHLRKLVHEGKAEQKKFKTTRCKDGRAMAVTYFRLKK